MLRLLIAQWLHGSSLAVDPRWRAANKREAAERRRHRTVRHLQAEKKALVHAALAGGRR